MVDPTGVATRRRFLLFGTTTVAAVITAACGATSTPAQPTAAVATPPRASQSPVAKPTAPAQAQGGTSKAQGKVTAWYVFAGDSPQGKSMPQLAKAFNQANPGITVDVQFGGGGDFAQKILTAVAGGAPPDAMTIDVIWPARFATANAVIALDEYAKRDGENLNDFIPAALDACTYNGKVYALPLQTGAPILVYNKTLFKEAGLDPEKPPATWDEQVSFAQKLTKAPGQWGVNVPLGHIEWPVMFLWHPLVWQNGGELTDKQYTKDLFNSQQGVEALQYWVDLIHKYKVGTMTPPAYGQAFASGKFAMSVEVPSEISYLEGLKVPFEFGTAVLPKKVAAASNLGGWNWAVAKGGANPDGAWEWVRWATSRDSLISWNQSVTMIAPRKSVQDSTAYQKFMKDEPHWKGVLDTIPIIRVRPKLVNYLEWSDKVGQAIESAMYNRASAKDALDQAAKACDEILAKEPHA